jgi:sRNA-binding carbon storage regulator CsrA
MIITGYGKFGGFGRYVQERRPDVGRRPAPQRRHQPVLPPAALRRGAFGRYIGLGRGEIVPTTITRTMTVESPLPTKPIVEPTPIVEPEPTRTPLPTLQTAQITAAPAPAPVPTQPVITSIAPSIQMVAPSYEPVKVVASPAPTPTTTAYVAPTSAPRITAPELVAPAPTLPAPTITTAGDERIAAMAPAPAPVPTSREEYYDQVLSSKVASAEVAPFVPAPLPAPTPTVEAGSERIAAMAPAPVPTTREEYYEQIAPVTKTPLYQEEIIAPAPTVEAGAERLTALAPAPVPTSREEYFEQVQQAKVAASPFLPQPIAPAPIAPTPRLVTEPVMPAPTPKTPSFYEPILAPPPPGAPPPPPSSPPPAPETSYTPPPPGAGIEMPTGSGSAALPAVPGFSAMSEDQFSRLPPYLQEMYKMQYKAQEAFKSSPEYMQKQMASKLASLTTSGGREKGGVGPVAAAAGALLWLLR